MILSPALLYINGSLRKFGQVSETKINYFFTRFDQIFHLYLQSQLRYTGVSQNFGKWGIIIGILYVYIFCGSEV